MYSKKKEKSKRLLKKIFQTDERITENCWHSFSADEKKREKKKTQIKLSGMNLYGAGHWRRKNHFQTVVGSHRCARCRIGLLFLNGHGAPVGPAGAHMSSTARPCDISVLCPVEIFSEDGLDLIGVIFRRRRPLSYLLNSWPLSPYTALLRRCRDDVRAIYFKMGTTSNIWTCWRNADEKRTAT